MNCKALAGWLVKLYDRVLGTTDYVNEDLLEEVEAPRSVDDDDAHAALRDLCGLSGCKECDKWTTTDELLEADWTCKGCRPDV